MQWALHKEASFRQFLGGGFNQVSLCMSTFNKIPCELHALAIPVAVESLIMPSLDLCLPIVVDKQ